MLQLRNINKSYNSGTGLVLTDVSLDIEQGGMYALTGRSGSGKTTLLNIMSSLLKPDTGEISLDGKNINKFTERELNKYRQEDISMIFQFHHLLPYMTALENVMLPFLNRLRPVGQQNTLKAKNALERVGLGDKFDRLPSKLSGGEQQRVAIARSIVTDPKIIFADEPTGSLDKKNGDAIIDILKEINSCGQTVVMVTHQLEYAKQCKHIFELDDGVVIGGENDEGCSKTA
jgi:putative ABC transport system ATP-binding protein